MKSKSLLHKKPASPAAILAATFIACLGMFQQADAAVTWLASDDGTNLTLTATGTLDTSHFTATSGSHNQPDSYHAQWVGSDNFGVYAVGQYYYLDHAGTSVSDPWVGGPRNTQVASGSTLFVWQTVNFGGRFYWNGIELPSSITATSSMTFSGLTVASAFGSNLDAGPVVIWRLSGGTQDTISVALAPVPEPSSTALLGLGGLALILRRRR